MKQPQVVAQAVQIFPESLWIEGDGGVVNHDDFGEQADLNGPRHGQRKLSPITNRGTNTTAPLMPTAQTATQIANAIGKTHQIAANVPFENA